MCERRSITKFAKYQVISRPNVTVLDWPWPEEEVAHFPQNLTPLLTFYSLLEVIEDGLSPVVSQNLTGDQLAVVKIVWRRVRLIAGSLEHAHRLSPSMTLPPTLF
ncbi:hypothetical protein A0H81_07149 [Grifola frondosa]|uniref:Uncharacterized protein n=1 Tax=Grifola frondosa TaxID=5627 RepID=A0A1C7M7Y1_GRIFR|nr:hypothetical protein A0H81_07149 [Grifola frondosa]